MLDAGAGRGKLASPVRSPSLVPENRNRGAASHWPVVFLQGGISPLVDPGSALSPSVGAIHPRPTTCCPPALACREKGRRNCGAADGACVSAFGWTRGMIGQPQAAMFSG